MYSKSSVTRFDHFVAWLLALGLYRLARGAMFVVLLAGAGCLHSHKAALARVPLVAAGERPLAQRLAAADLVVTATLAKTERDWRYEEPCGVLRHLIYGCADIPKAYQATLRRGNETWPVFYFKLGDLPHPAVGDSAVWLLRPMAAYHLLEYAQRRPYLLFLVNDPAPSEIYALSLHDALPISRPSAIGATKSPAASCATSSTVVPTSRRRTRRRCAGATRRGRCSTSSSVL